jgi:hypothetical protein
MGVSFHEIKGGLDPTSGDTGPHCYASLSVVRLGLG